MASRTEVNEIYFKLREQFKEDDEMLVDEMIEAMSTFELYEVYRRIAEKYGVDI